MTTASRACGCAHDGQDRRNRRQGAWCWPPAASRPTPNGAPATSARAGTSPRCAAPASTPATASAWRSTSAPCPTGHWSGCHAVGWDRNAPEFGDLAVGDSFQKHTYPFGIMLNADGERFVDEGADFRNYTYAKYGRVILEQPGQFAWQVFDSKVTHLLRDEYRIKRVHQGDGRHARGAGAQARRRERRQVPGDHQGLQRRGETDVPFDPNIKDGRARRAWRSPSPTGPTRSIRRRTRPTPSPAASPSRSAA